MAAAVGAVAEGKGRHHIRMAAAVAAVAVGKGRHHTRMVAVVAAVVAVVADKRIANIPVGTDWVGAEALGSRTCRSPASGPHRSGSG